MKHSKTMSVPSNSDLMLGWFALTIEAWLEDYERVAYRGHTMKEAPDGWLLILRGTTVRGNPVVAFVWADSPMDCWGIADMLVQHGKLDWRTDKYPNS